jgi:hypothetical protein
MATAGYQVKPGKPIGSYLLIQSKEQGVPDRVLNLIPFVIGHKKIRRWCAKPSVRLQVLNRTHDEN